jgi:hypothetical protein
MALLLDALAQLAYYARLLIDGGAQALEFFLLLTQLAAHFIEV